MIAVVRVEPPRILFGDPGVPGVLVELFREGTIANITVNATRSFVLEHRSAVFFDDFEDNPFTADRLVAQTCTWGYNATARSINISAASRGPPGWAYWCVALVNPAVLNITRFVLNGSTIYVAYLLWRTGFYATPTNRYDVVWVNSTTVPAFHASGFRVITVSGRTGDDHYSNVSFVSGGRVTGVYEARIGISNMTEYEFLYHVSTGINYTTYTAFHYINETLSYNTTIPPDFRRTSFAVGIGYWVNVTSIFSGTVLFDNLIVTVNHPPWYVNVTGLPDGYRVVLRSDTGHVVAEATSVGGLARLVVTHQLPVDLRIVGHHFRNAYIFRNATLEAYDPTGRLVGSSRLDFVVGGDRYRFVSVFSGVVLSIYSNMTTGLWCLLANATAPFTPLVNASLGLVAWNTSSTTVNVTILNGVVFSPETSVLRVEPPPTWTDRWLVVNVTGRFELPVFTNYTITLNFIWWVGEGVRVFYPFRITVVG